MQMGGGDTGQLSRLRADKPLLQHSLQIYTAATFAAGGDVGTAADIHAVASQWVAAAELEAQAGVVAIELNTPGSVETAFRPPEELDKACCAQLSGCVKLMLSPATYTARAYVGSEERYVGNNCVDSVVSAPTASEASAGVR